jgi:hypothetical protein
MNFSLVDSSKLLVLVDASRVHHLMIKQGSAILKQMLNYLLHEPSVVFMHKPRYCGQGWDTKSSLFPVIKWSVYEFKAQR